MTVVVPLSAFLRLISLLRLSEPMVVLSFVEILSKGVRKTTEASSSFFLPSNLQGQPSFGSVVAMWI